MHRRRRLLVVVTFVAALAATGFGYLASNIIGRSAAGTGAGGVAVLVTATTGKATSATTSSFHIGSAQG